MKLTYNGIVIKYKKKNLVNNGVPMDKEIGLENLQVFNLFCRENKLLCFLMYGTLLGAVREKNFIAHDEDIDLGMNEESYVKIFELYPELEKLGFKIVRFDERGLVSIMRKGYYIDIYNFVNDSEYISTCKMFYYPKEFFIDFIDLDFLGMEVNVPKLFKEFLNYEYGESWQTPIKYSKSRIKIMSEYLKSFVKDILPKAIKNKILDKKNAQYRERFMLKMEKYEKESSNN